MKSMSELSFTSGNDTNQGHNIIVSAVIPHFFKTTLSIHLTTPKKKEFKDFYKNENNYP